MVDSLSSGQTVRENHFKQHMPSFMDFEDLVEFSFSTTNELINHPYVQRWLDGDYVLHKSDSCIMVVHKSGKPWYVIGYVETPDNIEIPEWGNQND